MDRFRRVQPNSGQWLSVKLLLTPHAQLTQVIIKLVLIITPGGEGLLGLKRLLGMCEPLRVGFQPLKCLSKGW